MNGNRATFNLEAFTTNATVDPHQSFQNDAVLDGETLVYIDIHLIKASAGGNITALTGSGLDTSSDGSIKFMIGTGMTPTSRGFNIPSAFPANGGWVDLY